MYLLFALTYRFGIIQTSRLIPASIINNISVSDNNSGLIFVIFNIASQANPGAVKYQQGSSS